MKFCTRISRMLFWFFALLSIPVLAAALTTRYTPPPPPRPAPAISRPAPAPRPAPRPAPAPSRPVNNPAPAAHPYTPPSNGNGNGNGNGGYRPPTPNPSTPSHSYTPSSPASGNSSNSHPYSGTTSTYTPHTYTPGSSSESHSTGNTSVSAEGVKSSNGVTTYTPHSSTGGGASSTPTAPPSTQTNTFKPSSSSGASESSHNAPVATTSTAGGNTYTPHNTAPANAGGGSHTAYNLPPSSIPGKLGTGNSTLTTSGSQSVIHQVNTARSGMTGVNQHSIPQGQVSVHGDKSLTVSASNGRNYNLRPSGTLASYSGHGQSATFRSDGRISSVHTANMDINHGSHGERTIVSHRPDHSTLVSTGAHSGYSQHTVSYHGHDYARRNYVRGGHSFSRAYRGYRFGGLMLDDYLPFYYYDPLFYGWAYYPWGAPVPYGWGWAGSPWFGFYAGFFSPWDTYPSGAYWLTDYYLGQTLADGYQMESGGGNDVTADAGQAGGDDAYAPADTPITPEIKKMIADEVSQQLAMENAAAAKPDQAPLLDGLTQVLVANHLFVVYQGLSVATSDGQQCALSTGDVIKLVATPQAGSTSADLTVVSSRKGDCPAGLTVDVPIESLQEMQNNFRAQLDSGLQTLHAQQGQGGLPAAPYSAIAPPPIPTDMPPADNENVQAQLEAQQQQADQAETDVTQSAFAAAPQAHN